jgi:hypothetical protein
MKLKQLLWWRDNSTEDSTYESEVMGRCDHNFGDWTESDAVFAYTDEANGPYIREGHLVFKLYRTKRRYCENCGKREVRNSPDGRATVKLDNLIQDGLPLSEAFEKAGGSDEEGGRVILNESEMEHE